MSLPPISHLNHLNFPPVVDLTQENSSLNSPRINESANEEDLSDVFQSIKSEFPSLPAIPDQTHSKALLYSSEHLNLSIPPLESSFSNSTLISPSTTNTANATSTQPVNPKKRKRKKSQKNQGNINEDVEKVEAERPKKKKLEESSLIHRKVKRASLPFGQFIETQINRINVEDISFSFNEHFHTPIENFYKSIKEDSHDKEAQMLDFQTSINQLFSFILKKELFKKEFFLSFGMKRMPFYQDKIAPLLHEEIRTPFLEGLNWGHLYHIDLLSDFEALEKNLNASTLTKFLTNLRLKNLKSYFNKEETITIKKTTELFKKLIKQENLPIETEFLQIKDKDFFIKILSQLDKRIAHFAIRKFPFLGQYFHKISSASNSLSTENQTKEESSLPNPDSFFKIESEQALSLEPMQHLQGNADSTSSLNYKFKKIPKNNAYRSLKFQNLPWIFCPHVAENTFRRYILIIRHQYYVIQNDTSNEKQIKTVAFIGTINELFNKCLSTEQDKIKFQEQLNFLGNELNDFLKNGIGPILNPNLKIELESNNIVNLTNESVLKDLNKLHNFNLENLMLFAKNYFLLYQKNSSYGKHLNSSIFNFFMNINLDHSENVATLSNFLKKMHSSIAAKLVPNLPLDRFAESNIPKRIIKNLRQYETTSHPKLSIVQPKVHKNTNVPKNLLTEFSILKTNFDIVHLTNFAKDFYNLESHLNPNFYKVLCGEISSFFNSLDFNHQASFITFKEFLTNAEPSIKSKLLPYLPIAKYVACNMALRNNP